MRAERVGADAHLSQIVRMVNEEQRSRAPNECAGQQEVCTHSHTDQSTCQSPRWLGSGCLPLFP